MSSVCVLGVGETKDEGDTSLSKEKRSYQEWVTIAGEVNHLYIISDERDCFTEDNDKLKVKVANAEMYIAKLLKEKSHQDYLQDQSLKKLEAIAGEDTIAHYIR